MFTPTRSMHWQFRVEHLLTPLLGLFGNFSLLIIPVVISVIIWVWLLVLAFRSKDAVYRMQFNALLLITLVVGGLLILDACANPIAFIH